MDYTQSNSYVIDAATGNRMHLEAQAVPTAVSDLDINSLLWSAMEIVKAAGLVGVQFDKTVPATYQKLLTALRSAGVFQTADLGDKSTKAATTAFVQTAAQKGMQTFTSNGTFTVPAGVSKIYVTAVAGGGGGGGAAGNAGTAGSASGGSGGGAGQSIIRVPYMVIPLETVSIVIGSLGAAGPGGAYGYPGSAGTAGGNTVIGALVTLTGGGLGQPGLIQANGMGGGLFSNGYPGGSAGGDGSQAYGGAGASCPFGGGGGSMRGCNGIATIGGGTASGYGSGGGGGSTSYSAAATNGAGGGFGSPGIAIIEW